MGLLDGDKPSSLPSLSWDSVVASKRKGEEPTDEAPGAPAAPATTDVAPGRPDDAGAVTPPASTPMPGAGPAETVRLGTASVSPAPEPTPAPPDAAPSPPDAAPTPDTASPPLFSLATLAGTAASSSAPAAPPRPAAPPAPAAGPSPAAPGDLVAPGPTPPPPVAPIALPTDGSDLDPAPAGQPVGAAPPATAPASPAASPAAPESPVATTTDAPSPPEAPAPDPMPAPAPGLSLPPAAAAVAAAPAPPPMMFGDGATEPVRRRGRQRSGSGLGLLITLLVLAAFVAAAFVYGRPYLFPDDWDESAQPFAEEIESIRGTAIVEPFSVLDEPADAYESGFDADVLGAWETELPLWRAFGLADGGTNAATINDLMPARPPAYYSATDRQVHRLESTRPEQSDPATMSAAAEATLDQDYRWTQLVDRDTIERTALVRGLVAAEADHIRAQSSFAGTRRTTGQSVSELPAILDHRLAAPAVYAAVLGSPPGDEARMGTLETFASEMSGATELPVGPPAVLADGDVTAGASVPMDRSFWFLAFASRLPAATAHDLSETLVAASLTPVRTPDAWTCFAAVFDTPTPEQGFGLATALNEWVAAAPVETAGSLTGVTETAVQLQVCDPGLASATTTAGISRALLGYRAAELAVIDGVTGRGGGAEEVEDGLNLLRQSTVGDELAALPPDTAPADLAAEAIASVVSIVDASTAGLPVSSPAVGPVGQPDGPVEQPLVNEPPDVEPAD